MNTEQKNKTYRIVQYYSAMHQKMKAIEELTELIELLIKDLTKEERSKEKILDEIADVEIMTEQLRVIYCLNKKDISQKITDKLNRQIDRIHKETI